MTVSHLLFALVTTAYILFATRLEERDLVAAFGADYVAYRARTPMLMPRLPVSPAAGVPAEVSVKRQAGT
jgi:protein-S-isoprenylcysteine O-methyltransferase Ste14